MSEKEWYNGIHIRIVCNSEEQYKQILKEMLKIGKVSWTKPMRQDDGEWFGYANFRGSKDFKEFYNIGGS